jgi:hypothetical protein
MTTRTCNTPGCDRETRTRFHAYCDSCIGPVLRTGQPPVIERKPEWLVRASESRLPAKVRYAA